LKEKGYEDYVLFDEKNCCKKMIILLLKGIKFLSKKFKSKAPVWYRNFLIRKNNPNVNINKKMSRCDKDLEDRFYWTYMSEFVCNKSVKYETFKDEKKK